ncbi:unnamed protein product [Urochloa humidicola]
MRPQLAAQYYGSANKGLGFYHIDVSQRAGRFKHWAGFENFGVFTVEEGELTEEEIVLSLRRQIDKDWDWKLMKMEEYKYLVKFPPNKKVESIVLGKATYFYLKRETVMASLRVWDGDIEPVGQLSETWVVIKGVPPKWADWVTIKQIASSLGKLIEIDWTTLYASFYNIIRVKINCKEPECIPKERVVEMADGLYLLNFKVEDLSNEEENPEEKGGDDKLDDIPDSDDEHDMLDDYPNNLEENGKEGPNSGKSTKKDGEDTEKSGKQQRSPSNSHRTHSIRETLNNLDLELEKDLMAHEDGFSSCTNILKAMELYDSDDESNRESSNEEEEDKSTLPEEWTQPELNHFGRISEMTIEDEDDTGELEISEEVNDAVKQKTSKKKWGPVLVQRKSKRNQGDSRNAMKKAQDVKRKWKEENNTGIRKLKSLHISTDDLVATAEAIGIIAMDGNPVEHSMVVELE